MYLSQDPQDRTIAPVKTAQMQDQEVRDKNVAVEKVNFGFNYTPDWTVLCVNFQTFSGEGLTEPHPHPHPRLNLGLQRRFGLRPHFLTPHFFQPSDASVISSLVYCQSNDLNSKMLANFWTGLNFPARPVLMFGPARPGVINQSVGPARPSTTRWKPASSIAL